MKLAPLPTHLAAVTRSVYLALALFGQSDDGHGTVLAVQLKRLGPHSLLPSDLIRSFARDYGVDCAVLEPDSELLDATEAAGLRAAPMTLTQARHLLTGSTTTDWQTFFQALLAREPRLRRLVTYLRGTTNIELTDRWKLAKLLAVALGLAYADAHPQAQSSTSFNL